MKNKTFEITEDGKILINGEEVSLSSLFIQPTEETVGQASELNLDPLELTADSATILTLNSGNLYYNTSGWSSTSTSSNFSNIQNATSGTTISNTISLQGSSQTVPYTITTTPYVGTVVMGDWYSDASVSVRSTSYKDVNELVKNIFDILNRLNNNKVNSYELKSLVSMIRDVKKIRSEKISFEKLTDEEKASISSNRMFLETKMKKETVDSILAVSGNYNTYILGNALKKEELAEVIENLRTIQSAQIIVLTQKISEKQFDQIVLKFKTLDMRNILTSLYLVNPFVKISKTFIKKNFNNLLNDFLKIVRLPKDIFETKVMKYLNGFEDPEIWEYNLDEDFIIENYDNLGRTASNILNKRINITRNIIDKTDFVKDYIADFNSFYHGYSHEQRLVELTADMSTEDFLDLVRMIAEIQEEKAKSLMSEVIKRFDLRLLNEYEILEVNMYINRAELNLYYKDKIDKMPGLKLLLSLE